MKRMLIVVLLASCLGARADSDFSNSDFTQPYSVDGRTLALWHLDESPGDTNTVDSGVNGLDGLLVYTNVVPLYNALDGNKTWVAGMPGFGNATHTYWASSSDLNYGRITVPNASPLAFGFGRDFTIEFWIHPFGNGYSSGTVIIQKYTGADVTISYVSDNAISVGCYSGGWRSIKGTAPLPIAQWTHVALTFDRTSSPTDDTVKIYFNGEHVDTLETSGWKFPGGTSNPVYILNRRDAHGNYQFRGYLDEVRFSDTIRFPVPDFGTIVTIR